MYMGQLENKRCATGRAKMVQIAQLAAMLLWLMSSVANATTYYVATTGNNSNNGTDISTPFLTVKKCVDVMIAGDTCFVRGGTYAETAQIKLGVTGTATAPIKLMNYPGEKPVIVWPAHTTAYRILVENNGGANKAMGYLTIEGFEVYGGWEGIKFESLHNSVIRRNHFHDGFGQGLLGYGHHNTIEQNIINHHGDFVGQPDSNLVHGLYISGDSMVVRRNLIYDNIAYGITQNGSPTSYYTPTKHPSAEFAGANNWVVTDNTIAYNKNRSGVVVWGDQTKNARYENNIFYENSQAQVAANGFRFVSASASSGIQIKNNHAYATAPSGTTFNETGYPADTVFSGNVTNVSAPAFISAGATISGTPDFRLTASSPVNIALVNEHTNNPTLVVGAFKTVGTPTANISTNKITLTFPMSTSVPIQVPSAVGFSVGCTGSSCPASPTVSSASRVSGTDSQVEIVIAGIAGNACVSTNQNWTLTYDSSTGSLTAFDDIGPYPGLQQKIFSFSGLAVTNQCSGGGPPSDPGTPHIRYKADDNTGTNLNDESANNLDGTLTGGGTWGTGHTGYGVVLTSLSGQYVAVPWGSGINPTTQSFTVAFGVFIDSANVSLTRTYIGSALGTNQRFYISTRLGAWGLGIQTSSDSTVSELSVTSGWNHIVVLMDKDTPGSGTGTATLCVNGVCSTNAGGKKAYTSYTLASNLEWGRLGASANGPGGTFDDFFLYLNVSQTASQLYSAWTNTTPSTGTFSVPAYRFQAVDTLNGAPVDLRNAINENIKVVANGAVALLVQVNCDTGANCDQESFRLESRRNGGSYVQIPNVEGENKISMWGGQTKKYLNTGTTSTRLTGSCPVTAGSTIKQADQIPVVDLPEGGCVVLRYLLRFGNDAGAYHDFRVTKQDGSIFTGTVVTPRVDVITTQASGGF
jgi:hypothetical protein